MPPAAWLPVLVPYYVLLTCCDPQEYPANLGCFRKPKGFGFVFCHVFCPMCSAMEVWLKPLEFPLRPSVTRARRFFSGQRAMVSKLGTGVPDVKQAMSVGIILGDFAFIVPCHVLGRSHCAPELSEHQASYLACLLHRAIVENVEVKSHPLPCYTRHHYHQAPSSDWPFSELY